jgi:glucokinase
MILAGDIGGTNTRLALFDGSPTKLAPIVIQVFPSRGHSGPEEILREFRGQHGQAIEAASFGIAGPVRHGRSQTPNLPWVVDSASMAEVLGLPAVDLVNDLEANAYGIAELGPEDLAVLHPGAPDAGGNRALISAGTGLGEAGLLADGDVYRPYPSEGGHCDFAPQNETEIHLLQHLMARFGHVSFERVLSGPGLYNIYQFFRDTGRAEEPSWLAEEIRERDPSTVISQHGLKGSCDLCVQTLDLFVSFYGAEAGNLALKAMATGGIFIGGGIAPKILPKLREPSFLKAFTAKGRVSGVLEAIPVSVILNDKTALLGAAHLAALSRSKAQGTARPS